MVLGPAFEEEERPLGPALEPNGREERKSIASRAFRTFEGDSDNPFLASSSMLDVLSIGRALQLSKSVISSGLDVD